MSNQHHFQSFGQSIADVWGIVLAMGVLSVGWWRQQIHEASTLATDVAPILACILALLQIGFIIWKWSRRPKSHTHRRTA